MRVSCCRSSRISPPTKECPMRWSRRKPTSGARCPRAHRPAEALIARLGGDAVGFALFFHNFSTFLGRSGLYLEDLFVKPEWRGRGIGHQLLVALARLAVERRCGRMEWSVLDWNALAMKSYRRVGAAPLDEWTVWRLTGGALESLAAEPSPPDGLANLGYED